MILEILTVLILSQLVLGLFLWYQVKDLYRYPNVFGFPVIGNLYYFYKGLLFKSLDSLHNYLVDYSDKVGNGLYFGFIKGKRSVVLSCPHIIEEISYNPNAAEKAPEMYGVINPLIRGTFLYCPIDDEWKLRRKEVNSSLTKSLIDGPYLEIFKKAGRVLTQDFEANQDNVDLIYHCTNVTLNVVKQTHFGLKNPKAGTRQFFNTWVWVLYLTSLLFSNPLVALLFSYCYKIVDKILMRSSDSVSMEMATSIRGQMKNVSKDPSAESTFLPLSVMIALRNKSRNLRGFETKRELYELLFAGSQTTSTALSGSLAFMATLPEIQDKVWKEQYEIFGTSDRDPNLDDLRKMSYMDKFLKEIFRFFGPGVIAKRTTGEVKAGGVTIPAGTLILLLLDKIRFDPKFWKDPHVFNPEKSFEDKPKYANSSFGVGVRSCPGMYYSRQELKIILSIIIRKYKLVSQQKCEDFRYESQLLKEIVNLKPIKVEPRI